MMTPIKREHSDDEDGHDEEQEYVLKRVEKSKPRSKNMTIRRPRKKRLKLTKTSENLLMKLPGELRNVIYSLALSEKDAILVRIPKKGLKRGLCKSREYHSHYDSVWTRWREPGPLRTSQQIREEALSVYYGTNHFVTFVHGGNIEQACTWIRKKQDSCARDQSDLDGEPPVSFKLEVTSAKWKTLESWIALAKLFYEIWQPAEDDEYMIEYCRSMISDDWEGRLLSEVAVLGAKAKQGGLGQTELRNDSNQWAVSAVLRNFAKSFVSAD